MHSMSTRSRWLDDLPPAPAGRPPGLLAVSALARRHYNLKAAAGLGLTLPPSLLKQANRLIQ
jgi:hypothetical protein